MRLISASKCGHATDIPAEDVHMLPEPRPCNTHSDLFNFAHELPNLAESLLQRRKTKIVAIGSSSTAGEADIVPYPSRLELLLRGGFHHRMIDVLNRGLSGQEAPSELSRFEADVFAETPALVIWQVGTNAVFRKEEFNFDDVMVAITAGLRWLKNLPIDVVMMDLQFTPAVVEGQKLQLSEELVRRIARAAEDAGVNVFRRFDLMRHWVIQDGIPIGELVRERDENKLHMSDWATNCVTLALFRSIMTRLEAAGVT
jgi:acyl-CoA thioesterase-1